MSDEERPSRRPNPADERRDRLAAELRANLHKRKALARARSARPEPGEPGGKIARCKNEGGKNEDGKIAAGKAAPSGAADEDG